MRDTKINRCNWLIRSAKETFATRFARSRWIVSIESKKCFTSELRKLISVGSTLYSLQLYRMAFRIRISRNRYKYGKYIYIQIAIYIYIYIYTYWNKGNKYIYMFIIRRERNDNEERKEKRGEGEEREKKKKIKQSTRESDILYCD